MRLRGLALFNIFICFICVIVRDGVNGELLTTAVGAGIIGSMGAFYGAYTYAKCKFVECCDDVWIHGNIYRRLETDVSENLYGQHIAKETVIRAVNAHVSKKNPNKALVMSFHGWTGSGKNYLAKMIAKAIFKKDMHSNYVHLSVATLDFPHPEDVEKYKEQLRVWIKGNLSLCERSLFIFDEMDKMPLQLMDVILPFIDFYDHIGGVDPRKSVFLFLSNAGGTAIAEQTLSYYDAGKAREDITYKEMESIIKESAYNEGDGGLKMSRLIDRHMIDYFIPFLPLERRHVIMCFRDYLKRKLHDKTDLPDAAAIEELADSLHYFPKVNPVFSISGCKHVEQKADFMFSEFIHSSRFDEL